MTKQLLESSDLVMVTAAHTNVDYEFVQNMQKPFLIQRMR